MYLHFELRSSFELQQLHIHQYLGVWLNFIHRNFLLIFPLEYSPSG